MRAAETPISDDAWFKSSHSGASTTECVEAAIVPGCTAVRDSRRAGGPVLRFTPEAWQEFLAQIVTSQVTG